MTPGLAACGGSTTSGPKATVTGHAGGGSVATTDAVAIVQSNSSVNGIEIGITNVPDTCGAITRHVEPPSTTALSFVIALGAAEPATGTYKIAPASATSRLFTSASYATTDAKCGSIVDEAATSGSITISSISVTAVTGSFDVTMSNGDHLTGNFDAPTCAAPATSNTPAACGS